MNIEIRDDGRSNNCVCCGEEKQKRLRVGIGRNEVDICFLCIRILEKITRPDNFVE